MIRIKRRFIFNLIMAIIAFLLLIKISSILVYETKDVNLYTIIDYPTLKEHLRTNDQTIVYFYKRNCIPCNQFKQLINRSIDTHNYEIYALNVEVNSDEVVEISNYFDIRYTPTIVMFKEEKEIKRLEEVVSYDELISFMEEVDVND